LADQLGLPITALTGEGVTLAPPATPVELPKQPFDSDAHEYRFPNVIAAKLAIAADLGRPLAKVTAEDRAFIDQVLTETLIRRQVLQRVRDYFRSTKPEGDHDAG
jgi:hypothetical protein